MIAMPSFGGRAPAAAIERLKKIHGNGNSRKRSKLRPCLRLWKPLSYFIQDTPYCDGSLGDPVPVEKAFASGRGRVVLLLTKPENVL